MIDRLPETLELLRLNTPDSRPCVGVSACLLGRPVRYDGDHRKDDCVSGLLARYLDFREYCPEVGIGMSVPRPPIQVVRLDSGLRVRGVNAPREDVTDALAHYAQRVDGHLDGFVFKARSPSCGLGTTPVYHPDSGEETGLDSGQFARTVRQRFPALPACNESDLEDADAATDFLLRVYLYRQYRRVTDPADYIARMRERSRALSEPLQTLANRLLTDLPIH